VAGVGLDALFGDPRRGHPWPLSVAPPPRSRPATTPIAAARRRARATCVLAVAVPAALAHRRPGAALAEVAAVASAVWAVTGARSLHSQAERPWSH